MITSGARAMMGSVCEATISGYTLRRTVRDQSTATARTSATTIATATPNTAALVVVQAAGQRLARSDQVDRATRVGDGNTSSAM
jgi:hypothetical protein